MDERLFETLARVAHEASPPSLCDEDHERMVEAAMRAAEPPGVPAKPYAKVALASAAVLMLAAASAWLWAQTPPEPYAALTKQAPLLTSMSARGDGLSMLPGSQFDIESTDDARRYRLHEGAILFDVAALVDGESFTVFTEEVEVRVRGTVFSVERFGAATSVHVYEGRVEVEAASGGVHFLDANMTWASTRRESLFPRNDLLVAAGQEAAERRARVGLAAPESDERDEGDEGEPAAMEPVEQAMLAPPSTPREPRVRRGDVRAWLGAGEYERARVAASRQGWPRLEGDALRALGRFEEAAQAYDEVGDSGASYDAAAIRFRQLGQAAESLATLAYVDDASDVAERALALRVRVLLRLHRDGDAQEAAVEYRSRYPDGTAVDWVERVN